MDKHPDVLNKILSSRKDLSNSEKLIGNYIVDRPDSVTDMTVRELAERTGTSPATVSRFARTLGFRSYSEMRTALALTNERKQTENFAKGISLDSVSQSVSLILHYKIEELTETAMAMDPDVLTAVVEKLSSSRMVLIVAVGNTIPIGMNAAFKLNQAGVNAFCPTSAEAMISASINLTDEDLVLVLSTSGASERLDTIVDNAEDAGTTVAMITDNVNGKLASRAQYVIRASNKEPALSHEVNIRSLRFSQMSISFVIEVLFLFSIAGEDGSTEIARLLYRRLIQ